MKNFLNMKAQTEKDSGGRIVKAFSQLDEDDLTDRDARFLEGVADVFTLHSNAVGNSVVTTDGGFRSTFEEVFIHAVVDEEADDAERGS